MRMGGRPDPRTVEFARSRIGLVKHAVECLESGASDEDAKARAKYSKYSLKQGVFYPAIEWVPHPLLVSEGALAYARRRGWADPVAIFGLRRDDLCRTDGVGKHGESGLVLEHVYTGTMFVSALRELHRSSRLNEEELAVLLWGNYRCAWLTRSEDKKLKKSRRGATLVSALEHYRDVGISFADPP